MPKVFISYRREDSIDIAGRIYDRLVGHFGKESVFMDVDSIPYGVDFRTYLGDWVSQCDVLLAVIGDGWLDSPRLGEPADFVTIEITAALRRDIPVIPVLVGRMTMPTPEKLPDVLSDIVYRNAAEVRSGRDFHPHMDRLIRGVERHFKPSQARRFTVEDKNSSNRESEEPRTVYVTVEPPAVPKPTNLGFDGDVLEGMPFGWFNSFGFVSGVSTEYDVSVLPREDHAIGKCVRMHRTNAGKRGFGSLMQRCPARSFVGNRIRLVADLRTEKLDSWAGVWLRIDGPSTHLFFDNMSKRPIRGSTSWTNYVIETSVPEGSEWLNYGILLVSNGTIWADNFAVLVRSPNGDWNSIQG